MTFDNKSSSTVFMSQILSPCITVTANEKLQLHKLGNHIEAAANKTHGTIHNS